MLCNYNAEQTQIATSQCMKGAPFDTVMYHHKRVFVVAEVDDTYVYHIHLGITSLL